MSRWRALVIVLVGCCVLLGGMTMQSTAPAVASSTATTRTAPRDLTKHFPLGPQRLCCQSQSASRSQTAAAPSLSGATPGPGSGAGGNAGSTHHSSSGVAVVAFWIIVGGAAVGLLAVGVADVRRAHRESAPALPAGLTTADYLERARAAADLVSRAHRAPRGAGSQPPEEGAGQERRRRERPQTVDELAHRRADPRDRGRMAFNMGVILHERGDVRGAMAAYRRAERQGDPDAAFNLGLLLCEAGDLDAAEESWRRSARRGAVRATEDLGFLVGRRRERQAAGTEREGPDR